MSIPNLDVEHYAEKITTIKQDYIDILSLKKRCNIYTKVPKASEIFENNKRVYSTIHFKQRIVS